MNPWEKPCPNDWSDFALWDELGHPPGCPTFHGTGYVPMTTSEMLEALRKRCPTGYPQVQTGFRRWDVWTSHNTMEAGSAIDGALRAALESLNG